MTITAGIGDLIPRELPLFCARMKLVLGAIPFLGFGALMCVGIVKAVQPDGSAWLLIASVVLFFGMMGRCCLPPKH